MLLQTRGLMTAESLAAALEVSVRTIYRDLDALSGAGFPVYAERGPGGGCRLLPGYRTNLTGLSPPEAEALAFAALPGAAASLGIGALAAAAHLKVLTALSPEARETITAAQQRFHLDPQVWFQTARIQHPLLPELARAVWDGRRVSAAYRRPNRAATTRTLDPLGLVLKQGLWYLAAGSQGEAGGIRTYRVSRFAAVAVLDETVARPPGFDLAAWWETNSTEFEAGLPAFPVTVRVSPAAVGRLFELADAVTRAPADPRPRRDRHGWERRILIFEREDWAEAALLRLGADIEVLEPRSLRDRLAATAARLSDLYVRPVKDD